VAVSEPTVLEPLPAGETPSGASLRSRFRSIAIAFTAAGAVVLLVAMYGIRGAETTWRAAVAAVGGFLLWQGVQRLGQLRFGNHFRLGLWVAMVWLAIVVFCALFADFLPIDHYDKVGSPRSARPALVLEEPLGRDSFGRSNLSRVVYGARTSLTIGAVAVGVGLTIGTVLGLLAGYFGRAVDVVVNIYANATLAFPPLILLLAVVAVFQRSVMTLALGLAFLSIPTYARLTRAQTLTFMQREFVLAARAMGATSRRIMFREVLPNAFLPVAAYSFLVLAVTIVAEGSLSYLGLGIPPPRPTWGGMVADGQLKLKTDPHLVFVPAVVMFLTIVSLNRVGEWARIALLGERAEHR
jgi:peptide/nickel transport system permease protein